MMPGSSSQRGLTLVELVMTIVVLSVAVTGIFSVMNQTVAHSADPVIQHQAAAIAEAYLEEATLKSFNDPDTGDTCPTKEANRGDYDNVCDYNGLNDSGAKNQLGAAIAGLGAYTVTMSVVQDGNLGPSGKQVPSADALLVQVTVNHPNLGNVTLSGYRTNY